MHTGYTWFVVNPEQRDHLREINEARAAAFLDAVSALGRAAATVIGAVTGLPRRLAAARRARRTRAALAGLSDAMLDDIGLARGEIETIVEAVRRSPGQDPLVTLGHRAPGADAPTRALPLPRQVIGTRRLSLGHAPTGQDSAPRAA